MDKKNVSILFLTSMYPQKLEEYYDSLGFGRGGQNNTFIEENLLCGFDLAVGSSCVAINKLLINSGKKIIVPRTTWKHNINQENEDVNFSYLNLPILSSNFILPFCKKEILNWIERNHNKTMILIAYPFSVLTLDAIKLVKKKRPDIKTVLIVPDLPEYMFRPTNDWKTKLKNKYALKLIMQKENRVNKYIDLFALFSPKMNEKIDCEGRNIVMEGVSSTDSRSIQPKKVVQKGEKTIFYGGGLHGYYGVNLLLDAFEMLDKRFHLVLCGYGDCVPRIKQMVESTSRIHYLGGIPRKDLLALQNGADVLVNPLYKSEFSRYSFPSKTIEYLSSGIPCVGFRLDCIPEEYDDYINYAKEENAKSLAELIKKVCLCNDYIYKKKAESAQKFMYTKKNGNIQAERIVNAVLMQK